MDKKTKKIVFQRQLWPQPPKEAKPYWWGLNTLSFKLDGETVWEQEPPETSLIKKINSHGFIDSIEKRWSRSSRVEYNENFGWVLICEMAHVEAEQVWSFVLNDLDYTKLQHYDYEKKAYPPQTRYSINNQGSRSKEGT